MLSKIEYDNIARDWQGKIYQKWRKLKRRLPMIERNISFFKDMNVLEIGANAGMYGYFLYPVIKEYIGVEVDWNYCKQFKKTFKNLKATLIYSSFENLELRFVNYDVLIASYVLHHFNLFEQKKLTGAFDKCNKVAIFTRSGDPFNYGHNEVGHNPLKWWKGSMIKYTLENLGFSIDFQLRKSNMYDGIYLILAERKK